jgi:hypothetical protein
MAELARSTKTTPVHALAKQRYTALAPRFWHGMTFRRWVGLVARNRFNISLTRVPTAVAISAFSLGNSVLSALQGLIYGRRIAETEIKFPPLFIVGHWRSGTTLLHELLIRDERHTYATTCQCFAPEHFLLTEGLITSSWASSCRISGRWTIWKLDGPARRRTSSQFATWACRRRI